MVDPKLIYCYNVIIVNRENWAMKLIKLDRRYHGFPKWTHALEFTKREMHIAHFKHLPYIRAFEELYGRSHLHNPENTGGIFSKDYYLLNEHWYYDANRRRIYFKDPSVLTFVKLKIA